MKHDPPDKLFKMEYFEHLRNAKFCLIPRGLSSWTLRFYESFFVVSPHLYLFLSCYSPTHTHSKWFCCTRVCSSNPIRSNRITFSKWNWLNYDNNKMARYLNRSPTFGIWSTLNQYQVGVPWIFTMFSNPWNHVGTPEESQGIPPINWDILAS